MWLTLVCSNRQATTVCIHCWVRIDFKQVHRESRILAVVTSILRPLSLFLAVGQVLFRPLFQVANSIRVIKTKKQTSSENCSYLSAAQQIIEKDTLVVYLFGKKSTSYKYPTLQLIYAILIMWETKAINHSWFYQKWVGEARYKLQRTRQLWFAWESVLSVMDGSARTDR